MALVAIIRCLGSGRATCRHIGSNGNQGKQQGMETTVGSLAALEALAVSMHYHSCWCHGHMTVELVDGNWAGDKHVNNWKD